ncbi:MAG TPA: alpha/beta fold hydrolase [Thermoanaerobaculia bacterium]|nr:alpha/beta fold hydrolase [Thermoanaerobaculia bacterium]
MKKCFLAAAVVAALAQACSAQGAIWPEPVPGDVVIKDFRFGTGETLPEVKVHYVTLGKPARDAKGHITNAILILHGTGGSHRQFLSANFAGELFGSGQLLDAATHYIVIPDGVGHGQSTKPSDGLHGKFPRYTYADMLEAQHRLLLDSLGVDHLLLLLGTSMGGMHAWMWAERWPAFADGFVALASMPMAIAGRNRMWRKMVIDAIRNDPEWMGGDYTKPPPGMVEALHWLLIASPGPLQLQKSLPTREAADKYVEDQTRQRLTTTDANDLLYAVEASRDYDPSADLEKITAPLLAINFSDDFVNPPELGVFEALLRRVPRGRAVMIHASDDARGHGTHTWPATYRQHLAAFLSQIQRPR